MSTTSSPRRGAVGAPSRTGGRRVAASVVPLAVGAGAVVASLLVAVVAIATASTPIAFLGLPLPLIRPEAFALSLIGYLLTPVAVIVCYGWDAQSQRTGLRASTEFVLRPAWTTSLLWLSGVSIVLGLWHILNMSVPISEWLS